MPFTGTTMSLDEASILRASNHIVTVTKKACSPRAMFEFSDTQETRDLLLRFSRMEMLPVPPRMLLIARADLYREARSARGGL